MNYNNNYLKVSTITYPPKLKMYRSILMLTPEQRTQISIDTNDSCIRLYEYYIDKKNYKHFIPTNYEAIGNVLGWSSSKTEKCKALLVKAKYLLIKKDTLKDGTLVYRTLLGQEMVNTYLETKVFPDELLSLRIEKEI